MSHKERYCTSCQPWFQTIPCKTYEDENGTTHLWRCRKHPLKVECISCEWAGFAHETVHPKHWTESYLCPECHDVVERA